jgi:hypothetical protein
MCNLTPRKLTLLQWLPMGFHDRETATATSRPDSGVLVAAQSARPRDGDETSMGSTRDEANDAARARIADAIVTAAEQGQSLTLEALEAAGQPVDALGPDREQQARLVSAWMTRATQRVAEAGAAQASTDNPRAG